MATLPKIVILGGGFVGLVTARKLVQAGVVGKTCEVTVIDRAPAHVYTPWLYEVASGLADGGPESKARDALFVSASVPYRGLPGYRHVRFRQASVKSVDHSTKTVYLDDGMTVTYDTLVVALGSEVNYFGIPGLREHCLPLKSAENAIAIERKVAHLLKGTAKHDLRNIVVVGGGATGVELTGELMTSVRKLEETGELIPGTVRISIVDRVGPLSAFAELMAIRAVRRLKKIGVHVLSGFSVMEAKEKMLVLKAKDGSLLDLPCDLCVWAGGVMPGKAARELPFPHDERGRIPVEPTFQVTGVAGVYAAGDCIALMNPVSNKLEPMSAQSAVAQGKWIAKNLVRDLHGQPLKPFPFRKGWDVLIAVGGHYGVGHLKGVTISGSWAFYLRRVVDARYFFWILPWRTAFMKWLKGVIIYEKNDA